MIDLRTWEDALREQDKPVTPGPTYRCPSCERPAHAFAIVECPDGEWRCSVCVGDKARNEQPEQEPTWDDVRGVRQAFLTSCDWTQLPDVPEPTRLAWVGLRQAARDVTDLATPAEAMVVLTGLQEQADSL